MSVKFSMDSSVLRRFWRHVDKSSLNECWNWTASTSGGYGRLRVLVGDKWKTANANRVSWEIHYSDIPDGLFVCHKCDNKLCVNPEHLFLGTPKDNTQDMLSKNRHSKGSSHPVSKLTEEDVKRIFDLRENGLTHQEIADHFSVSRTNVTYILNRKIWKAV